MELKEPHDLYDEENIAGESQMDINMSSGVQPANTSKLSNCVRLPNFSNQQVVAKKNQHLIKLHNQRSSPPKLPKVSHVTRARVNMRNLAHTKTDGKKHFATEKCLIHLVDQDDMFKKRKGYHFFSKLSKLRHEKRPVQLPKQASPVIGHPAVTSGSHV